MFNIFNYVVMVLVIYKAVLAQALGQDGAFLAQAVGHAVAKPHRANRRHFGGEAEGRRGRDRFLLRRAEAEDKGQTADDATPTTLVGPKAEGRPARLELHGLG